MHNRAQILLVAISLVMVFPISISNSSATHEEQMPMDCLAVDGPSGSVFRGPMPMELVANSPPFTDYNPFYRPEVGAWENTLPRECIIVPTGRMFTTAHDPSCTTTTVYGRFLALDESGLASLPLSWAEVYIWDLDGVDYNLAELLAVTLTNFDGRFIVQDICDTETPNGLENSDGGQDILVQVATRSTAITVSRWFFTGLSLEDIAWDWALGTGASIDWIQDFVYTGVTTLYEDVHTAFNVGDWAPTQFYGGETNDLWPAALAYVKLLRSWDVLANGDWYGNPHYIPGHMHAHYLAPCTPQHTCAGEPFPHYQVADADCKWRSGAPRPGPNRNDCSGIWRYLYWQMHLSDIDDVLSPHVVAHLYGHFIMDELYHGQGSTYPGVGPLNGDDNEPADDANQFVGDFEDPQLPCDSDSYILRCEQRFTDRFYTPTNGADPLVVNRQTAWAEGWADFFATRVVNEASDSTFAVIAPPPYSDFAIPLEGLTPVQVDDISEGRVAASLNDVFDAQQDVGDTYAGGLGKVWEAFESGAYWTFNLWFHLGWKSFNDCTDSHGAKTSIFWNEVDYNAHPSLQDLQTMSSSFNGYHGTPVSIWAHAEDSDWEDTCFLRVTFEGPGFFSPAVAQAAPSGSAWTEWDLSSLSTGTYQYCAYPDDEMEFEPLPHLCRTLSLDRTPPTAPGVPTWTPGDETNCVFDVTWIAATDSESGMGTYELQEQPGGGGAWLSIANALSATTFRHAQSVSGSYHYRARATDRVGNAGSWSGVSADLFIGTCLSVSITHSPEPVFNHHVCPGGPSESSFYGPVDFDSTVSGGTAPYTYQWQFEGGTPSSSSAADPQGITFVAGGYHLVTLTVQDSASLSGGATDIVRVIWITHAQGC